MKINYAGCHHLSTVDWPGHASYTIFLRGCPMSCPHCQNPHIRTGETYVDLIDLAQDILSAKPFVSALVISGGEPTMQPDACTELRIWAKALRLKTAIETSGCRPIPPGFDKIFLDIKTSLEPWVYNSYTQDNKAYDNVILNLKLLDPRVTEIRYVIHEEDLITFKPFAYVTERNFPIRLLKGNHTSQSYFDQCQKSIMTELNLTLENGILIKEK